LPGLIHSANKSQSNADVELIKNIVHDYISNERTIILAVISAKNDYANQVILERCREVDPRGSRTLGVITKPDSLRPGSDNEKTWLDLAQNNMYFELGWQMLKNCADDEMTLSFEERNTKERIFFSTGSYRDLPSHMTGVDALRGRPSKLLYNHLKKSFRVFGENWIA
jgi:Dynamin family